MPRILCLLAVFAFPLLAHAQTMTTVGSSNVTINSAQLSGSVQQHSTRNINVIFSFNTSGHQGATPAQVIPPGSSTVPFTHTASALMCGRTYTFRAEGSVERSHDIQGDPLTFTTGACPFNVTTNSAAGTTLQGTVQPPPASSADAFFRVRRQTVAGFSNTPVQTVSGSSVPFSYTLVGAPCSAAITYQAAATVGADTVYGGPTTFTVPSCLPSESDFNADGQVDLMWRDPSTGALEVWYYRNTTRIQPFFPVTLPSFPANVHVFSGEKDPDDRWSDLLTWNSSTGEVRDWRISGGSVFFSSLLALENPTNWTPLASFGNSRTIIWRKNATNELLLWNVGQSSAWLPSHPQMTLAGTGDFDRDGTFDLLFQDDSAVRVWLLNPNLTIKSQHRIGWKTAAWTVTGAADIPTNALTAVLLRNASTGRTVAWLALKDASTGAITVIDSVYLLPDQSAAMTLVLPK